MPRPRGLATSPARNLADGVGYSVDALSQRTTYAVDAAGWEVKPSPAPDLKPALLSDWPAAFGATEAALFDKRLEWQRIDLVTGRITIGCP